jgi:hypothetical protein
MSASPPPSNINKKAENIVQKQLLDKLNKEQLEVLTQYAMQHPVNKNNTNELGSEEELKKKQAAAINKITVNNLRRNASRKNRKSRRSGRNDKRKTRGNRR